MVTISMRHPNISVMLTPLANLWSLPVPSLALVALNMPQSSTCQRLHLMTMLLMSFVLFIALQHTVALRAINL